MAKSFGYTAGGDTASLSVTGSPAWSYSYDARGRLASAAQGGTVMLANSYEFTGQRVARTAAGGVGLSHFVYGANGHLLAEYDGAAGVGNLHKHEQAVAHQFLGLEAALSICADAHTDRGNAGFG